MFDFNVHVSTPPGYEVEPERAGLYGTDHYEVFEQMARRGVWMQVTAGSLTGRFGRGPKYWGERMLGDGLVHLLATDAHTKIRRAPLLASLRSE